MYSNTLINITKKRKNKSIITNTEFHDTRGNGLAPVGGSQIAEYRIYNTEIVPTVEGFTKYIKKHGRVGYNGADEIKDREKDFVIPRITKDTCLMDTMIISPGFHIPASEEAIEEFIQFKNMVKLHSKYAKILYLFFRSYRDGVDHTDYTLEHLRQLLGLENKYPKWYDFKRYVLIPAMKEINGKTDINVIGKRDVYYNALNNRTPDNIPEDEYARIVVDSMARREELAKAKKGKKDEFYTQLTDIEKEMKYYKKHFENKVIFAIVTIQNGLTSGSISK